MTAPQVSYPTAPRGDHVDLLCDQPVRDPYRWLENDSSSATTEWEHAQDALYTGLSSHWPLPESTRALVRNLLDTGACTAPQVRAFDDQHDRLVFGLRRPGARTRCLVVRDVDRAGNAVESTVFDPMAVDATGLTILTSWSLCPQARYLAILTAQGGSDFSTLIVSDLATGQDVISAVPGLRFTSIAWRCTSGITTAVLYVGPCPGRADAVTVLETALHAGAPATVLDPSLPARTGMRVETSSDGRWLVVTATGERAGRDVWVGALDEPTRLTPFAVGTGATHRVIVSDDTAIVHTNLNAPRGRVCIAALPPAPVEDWSVVVPEHPKRILTGIAMVLCESKPVLALTYREGLTSELCLCSLRGGTPRPVDGVSRAGTITGTAGSSSGHLWVTYTDHVTPPQILRLDVGRATVDTWYRTANLPTDDIDHSVVEFTSADGTVVPMSVLARRDLLGREGVPVRPRPTIVRVYGGFGVSMTPAFTPTALAWVRLGGVWAVPALRGGGEFGRAWHAAGSGANKHRTFEDGIAAARHLVSGGWCTTDQLAVFGESNGGLTAAAMVAQEPDLFSAAVIIAPLFDMLRYEDSDLGRLWREEYGTCADPAHLAAIMTWSPYQRIQDGVRYPATLVTVFGGDSRVPVFHGRKAVAALQAATSAAIEQAPVVLRREAHTGHGARSVDRMTELVVDELAFLAAHTGVWNDATRTRQEAL